jgi:uncharacterized protein YqjF (DUF2071 family)
MLSFLKDHPFAVEAFFERSLVITYAVPKEEVMHLIPECLEPDTFQDRWAFIAVAMVKTLSLRPRGFPKALGNDFFLTGYRIFVRYKATNGKNLRGLYIIKSETDKKKMEFFGNFFTHYNYSTTDISLQENNGQLTISSMASDFIAVVDMENVELISLPADSPFSNWKEARRFAGPLPFTFTYEAASNKVLIIEGVRENWNPQPVKVISHRFAFLAGLGVKGLRLANAFVIKSIPYYWKKGRIEIWNQKEENSRVY